MPVDRNILETKEEIYLRYKQVFQTTDERLPKRFLNSKVQGKIRRGNKRTLGVWSERQHDGKMD